jgi:hypothetical protein
MSPLLRLAAGALLIGAVAAPAAAQLRVERRADLAAPVALQPGQGAILVGFRRPDRMSAGKSGAVAFGRYDVEGRDLIAQPRSARRAGDTRTYWVLAKSGDRQMAQDYALMIVSEGDYVMFGATPGPTKQVDNSFCMGAPTFRVNAGEVVYFGDLTPYINVRLVDGSRTDAMAYSSHVEDARAALARQPALASAFRPAELRNGASFGCIATTMLAYEVPGVPALPPIAHPDGESPAGTGSADAPSEPEPADEAEGAPQ